MVKILQYLWASAAVAMEKKPFCGSNIKYIYSSSVIKLVTCYFSDVSSENHISLNVGILSVNIYHKLKNEVFLYGLS